MSLLRLIIPIFASLKNKTFKNGSILILLFYAEEYGNKTSIT